jgi:hypothetical protein
MSQPFPFPATWHAKALFPQERGDGATLPHLPDLSSSDFPRFSTRIVDKHVHDACVSPSCLLLTDLHHGWAVLRAIKCSGMGVTIELQNLGDAQLCREITAHIEHAFAGRRGDWRVSIAGSRASENWEMRVKGPNGFERSYTLAGSAGEREPEVIRRLILQLIPASSA